MYNNKKLFKIEVISTFFILILGIILHFLFEWSGENLFIGSFSAVNESVWEHIKILFFPSVIINFLLYFLLKNEYPNYLCIKIKGILLGMIFIVISFYTYTGIIGVHFPIIDISIFILAIILGQYYSYKRIKNNCSCNTYVSYIILIVFTLSFIIFTYYTPEIGIFEDPVTLEFGVKKDL